MDGDGNKFYLQQLRKVKDSLQIYKAAREKTLNYADTKKEETVVNQEINKLIEMINMDSEIS